MVEVAGNLFPGSLSGHHPFKLERVYFRINRRNLLLGAILWSLTLVFIAENENIIKEVCNELLEKEEQRVVGRCGEAA